MTKKEHKQEEAEPASDTPPAGDAKPETVPQTESPEQKLKSELEVARQERDRNQDKYLRLMAEFDNFKKRTQSEVAGIIRSANEELILQLLEVLDNFERALAVNESSDPKALRKGVELIHSKLMTILKGRGLEPYDSMGREFNPDEHEAMMQAASGDVAAHHVMQEIERGYRFRGKVLRPARVIVSRGMESEPAVSEAKPAESGDAAGQTQSSGESEQSEQVY